LGASVRLAPGVAGPEVGRLARELAPGEVLVLENSRFEAGETRNDPELAERLAALADLYVDDAFGAAHRAHATTEGVAHLLPADLVLGRELDADTEVRRLDGIEVPDGWMGLDIGPRTASGYAERIAAAGTVFWNGPMGVFELEPFAAGTRAVAKAVASAPGT